MPRSAPALLTVCTLLTLGCAGSGPFGSKPSAGVTPDERLAVLAAPQDADGSPDGEWWPGLPQFNAELEGPGTLPGERFWVARRFQRLGEAEVTHLETALTLYDDAPFGPTSVACEAGVRRVAEVWFAAPAGS